MEIRKLGTPWRFSEAARPGESAKDRRPELEQKVATQLKKLEAMITAHSEANPDRQEVKKTLGAKAEEVIRKRLESYQAGYAAAQRMEDDKEAVEQLDFVLYYVEGDIMFLQSALDYIP